jgi:hypothetical protein
VATIEDLDRRDEEARATVALHKELDHCETCECRHWLRGCEVPTYCMEEVHVEPVKEELA